MNQATSVATSLRTTQRKSLAINLLARTEPISRLAARYQVSRKFVYQQGHKANLALDEAFDPDPDDREVLFYLPVTKSWLFQLILALILICRSSYRGVVELLRDLAELLFLTSAAWSTIPGLVALLSQSSHVHEE